jgi:hypothetical protein
LTKKVEKNGDLFDNIEEKVSKNAVFFTVFIPLKRRGYGF